MDLSDARKKISRIVEQRWRNSHGDEWETLESWRLIQEELNYAEDKRRIDHLEKERRATRAWMRPD